MIVFPGSDASINPNNIAAKFKEFVRKLDKNEIKNCYL